MQKEQKIKIVPLFFHRQNDYTGSTKVLSNIIECDYPDNEVVVITYDSGEGFLSGLCNVKIVPIFRLTILGKSIPILSFIVSRIYAFCLAIIFGIKRPVFYINTIEPSYAAIAGVLLQKKIVYHVHEKFVDKAIGSKYSEMVFNHIRAKRIFVSEYLKKQYPERANSEVVYNKLSPYYISRVIIRPVTDRKLDTVIMISSLSEAKGIYNFFEIVNRMKYLTFILLLSASKEEAECVFKTIPPNLEIYYKQSDVHPFLYRSDLLLNLSIPSLWIETFGMTILEAMPYGIPAIVPNIGGPTELVENVKTGYCVDVTNINEVVEAIERALDKNNYPTLCVNTLKRFELFS